MKLNIFSKNTIIMVLIIAGIILDIIFFNLSIITINNVVLQYPNGTNENISLPYSNPNEIIGVFTYTGTIDYAWWKFGQIRIIPDDHFRSMSVNGEYLPLKGYSQSLLCDYSFGFNYWIGKYLKPGKNIIELKVANFGGPFGLSVIGVHPVLPSIIILVLLLSLSYLILRKMKMENWAIIILLTGLAVRVLYQFVTNVGDREHDLWGHIDYIKYLAAHYRLPYGSQGWEFYQPPVYYISAAVIYKICELAGIVQDQIKYLVLEGYSLIISFATLVASIKIFDYFFNKKNNIGHFITRFILVTASALLVFWPSNIFTSLEIGNDVMLYFFYSIGLYYCLRWYYENKWQLFLKASIFSILALFTKTNAIMLIALLCAEMIIKFIKDTESGKLWIRLKSYISKFWIPVVIIFAGLSIAFSGLLINNVRKPGGNFIVPNTSSLDHSIYVQNNFFNYIWLDVKTFIREPFTSPWDDSMGRQYFWNYLLKSSLFGEFNFDNPVCKEFGVVISFLFLILLIYGLAGVFIAENKNAKKILPLILNLVIMLLAEIIFRVTVPASCTNDFRYIQPALISFCALYAFSMLEYRKRKWIKMTWFGIITAGLFVISTIVFYIAFLCYKI